MGGYIKEKRGEAEVGCLCRQLQVLWGLWVRVVEVLGPWMGAGALGIGLRCTWEGWGMWGSLEHVERGRDTLVGAMVHRDSTGELQGCAGTMGGPWGVSNTLVHVGGGPLHVSEGSLRAGMCQFTDNAKSLSVCIFVKKSCHSDMYLCPHPLKTGKEGKKRGGGVVMPEVRFRAPHRTANS